MNNLVLLCEGHHHQHHDGEFGIEALGGGRFRFIRDGVVVPARPDVRIDGFPDVDDSHADVAANAATTAWDGTRLDPGWAVACLAQGLNRSAA